MIYPKIQFEAGEGRNFCGAVNFLIGEYEGREIYAEIQIPDGEDVSEDYGYLDLKAAIIERLGAEGLAFWYDGQEQFLAEDAKTGRDVYVEIEEVAE